MDCQSGDPGNIEHRKFYERLTEDLKAAVRHEARYNTKDHNDQTRAERNTLAGYPVPSLKVPDGGWRIWSLFWSLSPHRIERNRISPTVALDWMRMNGKRLSTLEAGVLDQMDRQYLLTLAEEIELNEQRRSGG